MGYGWNFVAFFAGVFVCWMGHAGARWSSEFYQTSSEHWRKLYQREADAHSALVNRLLVPKPSSQQQAKRKKKAKRKGGGR